MKLPIVKKVNSQYLNEFINYWSKLYAYRLEELYNERINKQTFESEDIQKLFVWKNGMDLSGAKQKSVDSKVKYKLDKINELKLQSEIDISYFLKEFSDLSAVWKIFLLHIIKPNKYPIYDQHINRAYNYIQGLDYKNISASSLTDKEKEKFYFEFYLEFIQANKDINLKKLDEAFFTFGKFINTEKYIQIVEEV